MHCDHLVWFEAPEVRGWLGWHHHMAMLFMLEERMRHGVTAPMLSTTDIALQRHTPALQRHTPRAATSHTRGPNSCPSS